MRINLKSHLIPFFSMVFLAINNVVVNIISTYFIWINDYVSIGIALILSIVGLIVFNNKFANDVHISGYPLKTEEAKKKYAKRGLIVLVSRYAHADRTKNIDIQTALDTQDYAALDFGDYTKTNFGPLFMAIDAHKSKLEHCWLITTSSKEGQQSIPFAPVIKKYIQDNISLRITIHVEEQYSVLVDTEGKICHSANEIVRRIYDDAKALGIKKREMVTDVTGGLKGLAIGATLACLDKDENIEYIGADYNDRGEIIKGSSYPVIVDYRALIAE